jgi:hypothetical protein
MKISKVQQEREAAWMQHIFGPAKTQKATKPAKRPTQRQLHKNNQKALKQLQKAFGGK